MIRNVFQSTLRYVMTATPAVLSVLLVFELSVRSFGLALGIPGSQPDPCYALSAAAGTKVTWGSEGFGHSYYVADGEVATPHNEGREIIVLGDSHTEARQVDYSESYVSVAESLLWDRHHLNLRNLGHSAANFADHVCAVRQIAARKTQPLAIVVQIDTTDLDWHAFIPANTNYFAPTPEGDLAFVHKTVHVTSRPRKWWQEILLKAHLQSRWKLINGTTSRFGEKDRARRLNLPAVALDQSPAVVARTIALEAQIMKEAARGIPLILIRTPKFPYNLVPDSAEAVALNLLRNIAAGPAIDPGPEFIAFTKRTHRGLRTFANNLPEQGHLNRDGHAILGQMLASKLDSFLADRGTP